MTRRLATPLTTKPDAQPGSPVLNALRHLLWLELPWVALLALPLTLPGYFLPLRFTPTLILLLFVFWPLHALLAWRCASFPRHPLRFPMLALLAALGISLVVAVDLRFAWLMAAHLALGVALCAALFRWPLTQRRPALVAAALVALAAVLSVIGPPLLGVTLHSATAATLFVTLAPWVQAWNEPLNPNILAGGLLLAVPLSVAWGLAPWGRSAGGRLLGLVRSVLLLGLAWWLLQILWLTDSRGALAAAVVSLAVVLVLRWTQLLVPALVLTLLGVTWLLFNDPGAQLNTVMANGMANDYNSRMEIWVRSWRALRSHPFTGIGIGGFVPLVVEQMVPIRLPLSRQVTHAHNLLLQVGVDLGLLGLIAYAACMGVSGWRAAWAWRHGAGSTRALAGGVLAALVALNLHGIVDAPLWNSKLAFLPWLLFCLAVLLPRAVPPRSAGEEADAGQVGGPAVDEEVV